MNKKNLKSWNNCDYETKTFVNGFIDLLKEKLNSNLIGIYLHGSLAMDCYFPPKSDIDIIVVVNEKLNQIFAKLINLSIAKYSNKRKNIGDLELSIITKETAKNIPRNIPYELHYSNSHYDNIIKDKIIYDVQQYDNDLFSHLMYVKKRGICLYGKEINEVFGEVDWEKFMFSVFEDLKWIIKGEYINKSPEYGVLNICRVLKLIISGEKIIQNKLEGGIWGIENLPVEYKSLIEKALEIYCSNEIITKEDGKNWNKDELNKFCEYVIKKKEEYMLKNDVRPYCT